MIVFTPKSLGAVLTSICVVSLPACIKKGGGGSGSEEPEEIQLPVTKGEGGKSSASFDAASSDIQVLVHESEHPTVTLEVGPATLSASTAISLELGATIATITLPQELGFGSQNKVVGRGKPALVRSTGGVDPKADLFLDMARPNPDANLQDVPSEMVILGKISKSSEPSKVFYTLIPNQSITSGSTAERIRFPISHFGIYEPLLMTTSITVQSEAETDSEIRSQLEEETFQAENPPAPFLILSSASLSNSDHPQIAWQASERAESYRVVLASDSSCSPSVATEVDIPTESATIGPVPDGNYHICVFAINTGKSETGATNQGLELTVDTVVDVAPSHLKIVADNPSGPHAIADNDINSFFVWTAATDSRSGINNYTLKWFEGADCSGTSHIVPSLTTSSYTFAAPGAGTYSFLVTANDVAGNAKSSACSPSLTVEFTPPAALAGLIARPGTQPGEVTFAFDFPDDTDDYALVEIRGLSDPLPPGAHCTDGDSVVSISSSFSDGDLSQVDGDPGELRRYRACIFDHAGNLTFVNVTPVVYLANPGPGCRSPPCDAPRGTVVSSGFSEAEIGTTEYESRAVAAGDLDSDTYLDLVFGNYNGQGVTHLNDGLGAFSDNAGETFNWGSATLKSNDIALGDLNGDGALDLVVAVGDNNKNRRFFGNGAGGFDGGSDIGTHSDDSRAIALADFDRDGYLDVVAINENVEGKVYLGDSFGDLTYKSPTLQGSYQGRDVVVGDFSRDGNMDIVVANFGGVNKIYLGNGDGTFAAPSDVSSSQSNASESVVAVDLNLDGNLDLVFGNFGGQDIFHFGDGGGGFSAGTGMNADTFAKKAITSGDFNNDGRQDILHTLHTTAHNNRLSLLNASMTTFQTPTATFSHAALTFDVVVADFDGNGTLDFVTADHSTDTGADDKARNRLYKGLPP